MEKMEKEIQGENSLINETIMEIIIIDIKKCLKNIISGCENILKRVERYMQFQ